MNKMMKLALLCLMFAAMLLLSSCGCRHDAVEMRGATEATCSAAGYTGDTFCLSCGKQVAKGSVIPTSSHHFMQHVCTVCGADDTAQASMVTAGQQFIAEAMYGEALAVFTQAYADGYRPAAFCLGFMYENGIGVPTDATAAAALYSVSAAPDDSPLYTESVQEALARIQQ